jgi:hypothetical protein
MLLHLLLPQALLLLLLLRRRRLQLTEWILRLLYS